MTVAEIMEELKGYGSETTKKTFLKHGAREPFFGVKVQDLKKIQKKVKKDYALSLALYATGNSDAMYLAGLIADEKKMTKADLKQWVEGAYWEMISDYTVAWVAAESNFGFELGLEWIESDNENIASAGWATLSSLTALKQDTDLDIETYKNLLQRIEKSISKAANRVRYNMNNFVICVGSYITALKDLALDTANKIGKVHVDMHGTACKVPSAVDYINKVADAGKTGKKRKTVRC